MKSNPHLPSLKGYLSPTVECSPIHLESVLLNGSQFDSTLEKLTEEDPYSDTDDPFNF